MKKCNTQYPICLAVIESENMRKKGFEFIILKQAQPF